MTAAASATEIFILPDLGWACLLDVIARAAKPGAVLVTHTSAMRDLCEQTLAQLGRTDVTVEFRTQEKPHAD